MRFAGNESAMLIAYEWSRPSLQYPAGRRIGVYANPNWGMPRRGRHGMWVLDEHQYAKKYIENP